MDRIFLKGCNGAPIGLFPEEDGKLDLRVFEFKPLSISLNSQPGLTDDRGFTKRTAAAVLSLLVAEVLDQSPTPSPSLGSFFCQVLSLRPSGTFSTE